MKAIKSVKEVFESDSVIITAIHQGHGTVRVDARTRFHKPDMDNFFSNWVTFEYANRLCKENKGYKITNYKNFKY